MTVAELFKDFKKGKVYIYDSTTNQEVAICEGNSPLIDILGDYIVVGWNGMLSTKVPKIQVFCKFTEQTKPELNPEE